MSGSRLSTSCVNVFLVKPTAVSFFTATTCKKQPHRVGIKEQTTQKIQSSCSGFLFLYKMNLTTVALLLLR
jgi:hypothetical protein